MGREDQKGLQLQNCSMYKHHILSGFAQVCGKKIYEIYDAVYMQKHDYRGQVMRLLFIHPPPAYIRHLSMS
jgi:hypothetical protein